MGHEHISKVLKWEYRLKDGDMVPFSALYGCTECDATSEESFPTSYIFVDHAKCGPECFGCKAQTLQLNAGDATRDISDKKWQSKLATYRNARADGIQPGGTSERHVEAAYKASENLGKAYNAETMPQAQLVTKRVAEVVNTGVLNG